MATNQTNVHKKMDKILDKLSKLDNVDTSIRELKQQTNYLGQLVVLAKQDSQRQHQESMSMLKDVSQMARDTAVMAAEALRSSRETEKRVAELLAENRKH